MSASVKAPVYTSMVHHKLQHHWQATDSELDFHSDDLGLDLTELSGITGFLMNEPADSTGHFYPPWATDPEPIVKDEPMMVDSVAPRPQPPQGPTRPGVAAPASGTRLGVPAGGGSTSRVLKVQAGAGATFRKTAAGGVTRRRSSSKEEQAKKRRERNRVLARRTRLRKKFFFQSLQQQVAGLQRENERLKNIITAKCPGTSTEILHSCASRVPSMVADCASQATALLDQSGYLLVKALQSSQPSFCVTDPQLPDNPIVYASDTFIELTGYDRCQVLGRNCRFLQGPDTDPDAVAKIRKGIEEGSDTSVYLRQYKADGTVFWNHVFVAALRNSERKIINYVGIQHPLDKEPSPEVIACINNGDERESTQEEERQAWQDSADLSPMGAFMGAGWGVEG